MTNYRQTYPNSCGAASLMCAAIELGVTQIPTSNISPLWVGVYDIPPNGDRQSEIMIYSVTSGENKPPTNNSGYSLPSNIGIAAKELGLTTIAFVPKSIKGSLLLFLYGNEELNARNAGMLLKRKEAPDLQQGQLLLKILRVGDANSWIPAIGLHYVMQRPDGSIMDPALGQNFPNLEMTIQAHKANGTFYQDTELAILIT